MNIELNVLDASVIPIEEHNHKEFCNTFDFKQTWKHLIQITTFAQDSQGILYNQSDSTTLLESDDKAIELFRSFIRNNNRSYVRAFDWGHNPVFAMSDGISVNVSAEEIHKYNLYFPLALALLSKTCISIFENIPDELTAKAGGFLMSKFFEACMHVQETGRLLNNGVYLHRYYRVPAYFTSSICCKCGAYIGNIKFKYPGNDSFCCPCGIKIHSDLNATLNLLKFSGFNISINGFFIESPHITNWKSLLEQLQLLPDYINITEAETCVRIHDPNGGFYDIYCMNKRYGLAIRQDYRQRDIILSENNTRIEVSSDMSGGDLCDLGDRIKWELLSTEHLKDKDIMYLKMPYNTGH